MKPIFWKAAFAAAVSVCVLCESAVGVYAAPPPKKQVVTYAPSDPSDGKDEALSGTTEEGDAMVQTMTIRNQSTGALVTDTVYNILCMVTEAEVGSSFAPEAIKAQAIATHTYLLYHQQRGQTVSCPVKTPLTRVKESVYAVRNLIAAYDGKPIEAVYCASSGGGTQSSADYWGGDRPYLQAAESPYDIVTYTRTLDVEYVRSWFPESTFSENPHDWFEVIDKNSTGFALKVRAGDQVLSGYDFTSTKHIWLRSNKIQSIVYNEQDNTFTFTVLGNGHGVGLSQIGANGYAKYEGRDYAWIIGHYFNGVSILDLSQQIQQTI